LRQRIAEQKYALNNLMSYLDKFGDTTSLKELRSDLKTIQDAYAGVGENKGKTTSSKDDSGTMVIGTTTTLSMDDATLSTIATLAKDIRTKYTAL
jgi:hypothetical protein